MKPILFVVLSILLFTTACVQPASTADPNTGRNPFTPEAPAGLCTAADLQVSSSAHEDDGAISFGLTLINQSGHTCNIQPPAQVRLLSGAKELDVQPVPVQTDTKPLKIATSESVVLILIWRNYCGEKLQTAPDLQLTLTGSDTLTMPIALSAFPRCDDDKTPSTLMINPYSYPP